MVQLHICACTLKALASRLGSAGQAQSPVTAGCQEHQRVEPQDTHGADRQQLSELQACSNVYNMSTHVIFLYTTSNGDEFGISGASILQVKQLEKRKWYQFLGQEDPLEKKMATHSSILAWRIPWTEEPGRLQSMGLQELDMT